MQMGLKTKNSPETQQLITTLRQPTGRRRVHVRRPKMQMVRLGGQKARKGPMLVRVLRRLRLRWLKLRYICMIKKIKEYYQSIIKDMVAAGASVETFHQRLFMESTFAVPVMGEISLEEGMGTSLLRALPGAPDRPNTTYYYEHYLVLIRPYWRQARKMCLMEIFCAKSYLIHQRKPETEKKWR
ncbi:hypothetical protein HS088_TW02G00169 [Tripterygium wilfordii]|uniref:Uncharacterized protein n=1 Tax=Tripterygium wilfordii TaxID=458696 RepID=A0A7J7DY05_TRIWF|nr:hypothetical protein HS088_TW02G00169 [Tripterygium wilfordii]